MTNYKITLDKLAEHTKSKLVGDGSAIVDGISTIQNLHAQPPSDAAASHGAQSL